ncbi:MAG: hypothetical protein JG764_2054 [Clostridiales bacterium]|jgi:hypothetical protein|nr:hypothetical protein [Clostridiales bacterium]
MIDDLPDQETIAVKRFIEFILSNAGKNLRTLSEHLADPVYDDEPLTEEEKKAIEDAEEDIRAGRTQPLEEVVKELGIE